MCSEGHKTSTTKTDAVHSSKTYYQTTWFLLIYGLFNDAFNSSLYSTLTKKMISKGWRGKGGEGNSQGIIWGTIPTFVWKGREKQQKPRSGQLAQSSRSETRTFRLNDVITKNSTKTLHVKSTHQLTQPIHRIWVMQFFLPMPITFRDTAFLTSKSSLTFPALSFTKIIITFIPIMIALSGKNQQFLSRAFIWLVMFQGTSTFSLWHLISDLNLWITCNQIDASFSQNIL